MSEINAAELPAQTLNPQALRPADAARVLSAAGGNVQGRRAVRHVIYDTNFWKSFVYSRLAVQLGDKGCLSLFGDNANRHRLFAEHVTAEYRVRTEGRGRRVDEWKLRPEAVDNHWLDCLVGSAVRGARFASIPVPSNGLF